MSIESTKTIERYEAIRMLKNKGFNIYNNDCNERLADMLYEGRDSIFENYEVVDDKMNVYAIQLQCIKDILNMGNLSDKGKIEAIAAIKLG